MSGQGSIKYTLGVVSSQMSRPEVVGRMRCARSVFPLDLWRSRALTRVEVSALRFCFHSRACPCSELSVDHPVILVDFRGRLRSPPEASVSAACGFFCGRGFGCRTGKSHRRCAEPTWVRCGPTGQGEFRGVTADYTRASDTQWNDRSVSPSTVGSLMCPRGLHEGVPWASGSRTPSRPCVWRPGKGLRRSVSWVTPLCLRSEKVFFSA